MENNKPSNPEDAGEWSYALPGKEPVLASVFWDKRGFTAIYMDGHRQLPVHMLNDAKWVKLGIKN